MSAKEFDFSEMVCFSLYSASNAMIRDYSPQLREYDLTYPQFLVMMSLWNNDSVYIKELTEQTYLDAGTLTQVLKRLEGKGLIQRNKSLVDERAKTIVLTKIGLSLKDKTSHIFGKMECKIKLSAGEQKTITSICSKILRQLR